ncbi:MAG: 2OG-Fe(II) oxygenase family protein [Candidatus Neomarinimicrobiota bacterium]
MNVRKVSYRDPNAASEFTLSLKQTGFSVITDHPIDKILIDSIYEEWSLFFKTNKKFEYLYNKENQDGYFPFGTENAKGQSLKDLKEFFHIYPWGQYPSELSNATWALYNQLLELTSTLLGWIQDHSPEKIKSHFSMSLPEMIQNSKTNLLRVIHYPPLDGKEEEGAVRGAAHEDINLITLLVAGTQPGLQVQDRNGSWHDVSCDPGCLAVNTGDMLQEASKGYFPSTTHQIINPGNGISNDSRYSMPLFLHPQNDVRLSKQYTAKQYLEQRLQEIGLRK